MNMMRARGGVFLSGRCQTYMAWLINYIYTNVHKQNTCSFHVSVVSCSKNMHCITNVSYIMWIEFLLKQLCWWNEFIFQKIHHTALFSIFPELAMVTILLASEDLPCEIKLSSNKKLLKWKLNLEPLPFRSDALLPELTWHTLLSLCFKIFV